MKKILAILLLVALAIPASAANYMVSQSTTAYPLVFFMADSSDHITGKTGLSPTVKLSKAGGSGGAPSGSVTEIDNSLFPGWYKVAGNATDTNTLGPLLLHATGSGADPADVCYEVVAVNPQSANAFVTGVNSLAPPSNWNSMVIDGSGRVDISKIAGTSQTARDIGASVLLSSGTGTGQVKLSSGYIAPNWGDVGNPTTTLNLSGTTIKTATDVEADTVDIQGRLPTAKTWWVDYNTDGSGDTGTADAPFDTLAAAVSAASTGDTISFPSGTHALGSSEITISKSVTIKGAGRGATILSGTVNNGTAGGLLKCTVAGVTFQGLKVANAGTGAAVYGDAADEMTIANSWLDGGADGLHTTNPVTGTTCLNAFDTYFTSKYDGLNISGGLAYLDGCDVRVDNTSDLITTISSGITSNNRKLVIRNGTITVVVDPTAASGGTITDSAAVRYSGTTELTNVDIQLTSAHASFTGLLTGLKNASTAVLKWDRGTLSRTTALGTPSFRDIAGDVVELSPSVTIPDLAGCTGTIRTVLMPTSPRRTLDVTATGGAGVDWGNVESPTTSNNLSGTTVSTSQQITSVSGSVGSVTGAVGSVTGAVGSVTGNVGGNVVGTVASVTGNVGGNVVGSVASVVGNIGGNVSGSVGSVTGNVAGVTDKTGFSLSSAGIDAIWDEDQSGHSTVGSFGRYLDSAISGVSTGGVSVADIADGVWDEQRSGHTASGSFGQGVALANDSVTAAAIATSAATELADATVSAMGGITVNLTSEALEEVGATTAAIKRNTSYNAFTFLMENSGGSAITGATITAQRSIDGGAFASCTNSATEVANGLYKINLSAADLNGTVITLRFTATGARARVIQILTRP